MIYIKNESVFLGVNDQFSPAERKTLIIFDRTSEL